MSRPETDEIRSARQDPANQVGSGAWARNQSDEGLQYQIDGGGPGNKAYEAATRELDRREAARSGELQLFWIKTTFWATIALGVAAIVATLLQ